MEKIRYVTHQHTCCIFYVDTYILSWKLHVLRFMFSDATVRVTLVRQRIKIALLMHHFSVWA